MEHIIEPTMEYDFTNLYFGPPTTLAGGSYFTRIINKTNKPLYIQTPKSLTKQGFIKSGKKMYTDLMFDNNDTVFINWIENLESRCQELIFSKRETWFETKLEKDDIESAFTSCFKIFKSGKYYVLRVNVKPIIKIYDEHDQVILMDAITNDKTIISILEIQGLKFTSRNFQIDIELKQSMIVSPDPFLEECFIKNPNKKQTIKNEDSSESIDLDLDLDTLINESVKDLVKNDNMLNEKIFEEDNKKESIDLDISFEEHLEKDNSSHVENITNSNTKINSNANTTATANTTIDTHANQFGLEEANIEINEEEEIQEDPSVLKEFDLSSTLDNSLETFKLKKPNQVYYEIYQTAREKAKDAKKKAIVAYLEMKNIKKTYMLDEIDDSDSEFEEFSSKDNLSETSDAESLEDNF